MISIRLDRRWRVRLAAEARLPLPRRRAWRFLADFERYACRDVFHRRIRLGLGGVAPGAAFVIDHELAGLGVRRVGRILAWRPGRSYAFSDLSRRGPRRGFPHVYRYALLDDGAGCCRLRVEVNGRWTARFLPRPLVRLWLLWIHAKTALSIRSALLADELAHLAAASSAETAPRLAGCCERSSGCLS